MYTAEQIERAVKSKGYVWFADDRNKGYDVNIVGVRNKAVGNVVTNLFDDHITISFKDENGNKQFYCWQATTDAGAKAVKNFSNPKGCFRLMPSQYRNSHCIRLHNGKYEALGQQTTMRGWRDTNKNLIFDTDIIDAGVFGINIHRSNPKTESEYVENWSEGCQVFKKVKDFDKFMEICRKARAIHGNSFTYTLLESTDIK